MQRPRPTRAVFFLALLLSLAAAVPAPRAEEVVIFAAASTTTALSEAAETFESETRARNAPTTVRAVFAASSTLAKQIVQGAPADLFLSASTAWMDYLERHDAIVPGSRVTLLSNRLALIAPSASDLRLTLEPGAALMAALEGGRLAMGDPGHVPAGVYGKAALGALGLWQAVAGRTALAANVRAALALVERGEAAAGIVYQSDAQGRDGVRLVGLFPADSHPEIAYPLAQVRGSGAPAAEDFVRFLRGDAAQAIFRRHGFTAPRRGG